MRFDKMRETPLRQVHRGENMERPTARIDESEQVESPPGVLRTTLAYNDTLMLCHFRLAKGGNVPFHSHSAAQNGFLIRGRLLVKWESGREFMAEPGSSWCFESNVRHGAEAIEESEAVECFSPVRQEYIAK
jgi:quercetin dioxygenase-like cupin family protein